MKSIKKENCKPTIKCSILERNILVCSEHQYVAKLFYSFHTEWRVYLVMKYHQAGDLFGRTTSGIGLTEEETSIYLAEILAIDYIHDFGFIHRDLKPENILIAADGHLVLTDFGLCGVDKVSRGTCGTLEFMAPEIFSGERQTKAADWWLLGVLMYNLLTGITPFEGSDRQCTVNNILNTDPDIPECLSEEAISLITCLLTKKPEERIGSGYVEEIMAHPFFDSIDWVAIVGKQHIAPFVPTFEDSTDSNNFESQFTLILKEPMCDVLCDEAQDMFKNFEYVRPSVQEDVCPQSELCIFPASDIVEIDCNKNRVNYFEDELLNDEGQFNLDEMLIFDEEFVAQGMFAGEPFKAGFNSIDEKNNLPIKSQKTKNIQIYV